MATHALGEKTLGKKEIEELVVERRALELGWEVRTGSPDMHHSCIVAADIEKVGIGIRMSRFGIKGR